MLHTEGLEHLQRRKPTSGDLKSGDSLFFYSPPRISTEPPPAPQQIAPAPNRNDLGHYMKSYMTNILSKFAIIVFMPEIILFFVSD